MPSNIVETATKGTAISAPLDADARNAASVRIPFQAVGNRLAWLEAFVSRVAGAAVDVVTTAVLVPVGNLTLRLTGGSLIIDGNDDYNIHLGGLSGSPGGVQLFAYGNMASHLFTAGRTGRPNRKVQVITPAAGTTNIDPTYYDTIFVTPSVGCSLKITPTGTPVAGDWIEVVSLSGSNSAQILDPASAVPEGDVSPLRSATGFHRSAVYVYAGGAWRMAGASSYDP